MSEFASAYPSEPQYYAYRSDLECEPVSDAIRPRFRVYDTQNDIAYELGNLELALAQMFNGKRTLLEIQSQAMADLQIKVSLPKLAEFQSRLLRMGLLSHTLGQGGLKRDPATGISYGPLKRFLLVNLIKVDPQKGLDFLYRFAPWLCSFAFNALLLGMTAVAFVALYMDWGLFSQDVAAVYLNSWSWLWWHYPVILSSIVIHELGHALACRHFRVRVTDLGIGVYALLATGWVRPEQRTWSGLSRSQRAITILMGPVASFYYAAAGVLVWYSSEPGSPIHDLAVVMIVAAFVSLVPTLLPIFNGDTYLALTEFFNQPRLRQRSFRYCHQKITGKQIERDANHVLYWLVTVSSLIGWMLAWTLIAVLFFRFF